jgi:hypothetical protein
VLRRISANILPADICQKAKRPKPQGRKLLVNRIEFAQRWNVDQAVARQTNVSLKWTLGWNQAADQMSKATIVNINFI